MKITVCGIILILGLAMIGRGEEPRASSKSTCSAAAHAHCFSDVGLMIVEVQKVDACGFSYVNLEDNTVGLDNYVQFAEGFMVTTINSRQPSAVDFRAVIMSKKELKRGLRGIVVYCKLCDMAFTIRMLPSDATAQPFTRW